MFPKKFTAKENTDIKASKNIKNSKVLFFLENK